MRRGDRLVQRGQDRDHVRNVQDLVVLASKAVRVKGLDGHTQVEMVN